MEEFCVETTEGQGRFHDKVQLDIMATMTAYFIIDRWQRDHEEQLKAEASPKKKTKYKVKEILPRHKELHRKLVCVDILKHC